MDNEIIRLALSAIDKADKINHRLIIIIAALAASIVFGIISWCVRDGYITYCYFYSDYAYGTVEQYQDADGTQRQSVNAEEVIE